MTLSLFSPEPVRNPADFVGREREVVQLSELLAAGRSSVVVGPNGSGKSSLLLHLGQAVGLVLDEPPLVVYLDLSGGEFATRCRVNDSPQSTKKTCCNRR